MTTRHPHISNIFARHSKKLSLKFPAFEPEILSIFVSCEQVSGIVVLWEPSPVQTSSNFQRSFVLSELNIH